jgi:hypothetical protein
MRRLLPALALLAACSGSGEKEDGPAPKRYELAVAAPAAARVGEVMRATVTLTPTGGFHINRKEDVPYSFALKAVPPGVECPKTELKREDAAKLEDALAELVVSCTASEPGKKEFRGEYRFSVCTDSLCLTPTEAVSWTTEVE